VEYDDFNDITESIQNDDPSIADFRKSLLQSWEASTNIVDSENARIPEEEKLEGDGKRVGVDITTGNLQEQESQPKLHYRIGSLFGNATISKGADMIEDVMMAVKMNDGLPLDHEQMMIIVSPVSKEEMYAIRAIVNKYNDTRDKKLMIVLFNCKLQPMPQEIMRGETIYSILPLIGKKKDTASMAATRNPQQPKVVVLRRYPYDWQVYLDSGGDSGFDCIASMSVQELQLNRFGSSRGPSLEWIQSVVQRFLQEQSSPSPPPPPQQLE
jgi:hypothetical protein